MMVYQDTLHDNKSLYYSSVISRDQSNPGALFFKVSKLFQPTEPPPLNPSTDLCGQFLNFLQNKISTICRQLQSLLTTSSVDGPTNPYSPITPAQSLSAFLPTDEHIAQDLVTKARSTICFMDPTPTFLGPSHAYHKCISSGFFSCCLKTVCLHWW